jgi:hypothetical protein
MGLEGTDATVNSHIYFLVSRESKVQNKRVLMVMKFSYFPFSFDNETESGKYDKEFLMKGNLSLYEGSIDALLPPDVNDDINALCREKIRCCMMLEGDRVGGKAVLLVLQLVDRIYSVSLNKDKFWDSKVQNKEQKMLRFLMQRGPDQEIYYVEENKDSKCQ